MHQLAVYLARPLISLLLCLCLVLGEAGLASAAPQEGMSIRIVSGEGAELLVGSASTKDVVIEVVDATGKPVAGIPVAFAFPGAGRVGGSTELNQYLATAVSDDQGRASVRVRQSGPAGDWTLRVTAGSATAAVTVKNVTEADQAKESEAAAVPGAPAPSSPPAASSASPSKPKKSHTTLIIVIIAAAAGGGAAAALAGKKGSSGTTSVTPSAPISLSISLSGNGNFGTPPSH